MAIAAPARVRVIRKVSIDTSGYNLNNQVNRWFRANITPPDAPPTVTQEESPRGAAPFHLSWSGTPLGPGPGSILPSEVGDRVETQKGNFEVLSKQSEMLAGERVIGVQVDMLPVVFLYPLLADLYEMGADMPTHDSLQVALYTPTSVREDQGSYADVTAEFPIEYQQFIVENMIAQIAGQRYKITSPEVSPNLAIATATLRQVTP